MGTKANFPNSRAWWTLKRTNLSGKVIAKVLILCLVILLPENTTAQNRFSTDVTLSTGLHNHKVLDQTISPMIYRGSTAPLFIELNARGTNYYQRLSVSYSRNFLKSSITNTDRYNVHQMDNINFTLEYSIARKVFSNKSSSHMGGLEYRRFQNYRDLTMHTWASGLTIATDHFNSLSVFYSYSRKEIPYFFDMLEVNLSAPFLSYVFFEGTYNAVFNESWFYTDTDKDSAMEFFRGGSFMSFNKFLQVKTNIILTKRVSPRFSTKVSYSFNYYSFNKYENLLKVRSLNNAVLVGLTYNFTRHAE